MNKVFLIGNLTRDPEKSETASGVVFCRLGLAVKRPYTSSDGERQTDFFNVVTWRSQAENCYQYLHKGDKVAVIGTLNNSTYEDKDGNKRQQTNINCEEVEFLSPKREESESESSPTPEEKERKKYIKPEQQMLEGIDKKKSSSPTLTLVSDGELPF